MPTPVQISRQAPGADPDTAPDNPIQRNTNEMRRLTKEVARLNTELADSRARITEQTDRLESQAQAIADSNHALESFGDRMSAVERETALLRASLESVAELLTAHRDAMRDNTEALRRASRF